MSIKHIIKIKKLSEENEKSFTKQTDLDLKNKMRKNIENN